MISALGLRYGFNNFSDLRLALTSLGKDERRWLNYLYLHSGGSGVHAEFPGGKCDSPWCRSVTICTMLYPNIEDFRVCTETLLAGMTTSISALPAVLLIVVSLSCSLAIVAKIKYPSWKRNGAHIFPDIDWTKELFGHSSKKSGGGISPGAENEPGRQDEVPLPVSHNANEQLLEDGQRSPTTLEAVFTPRETAVAGEWTEGEDERPPRQSLP